MLCNNCGNQIPDNSVTCPNCGAPVNAGGTQVPFGTPAAKVPFMQQADESINFIALIIAVVGLICVFPAKVVLKSKLIGVDVGFSIVGEDAKYGIFMAAFFAITAVCLFLKKSHQTLVLAIINAIFCIAKMIQELVSGTSQLKDLGLDSSMASVGFNFFYWLVVICSILEVVAILVLPKMMKKNQ